ncbi:alpha/beta fold hydrolase [Nocardia huaxiensis]|uniref:alpha/beta fold hydrolase n=1 Tax=Nocardia huaxiensis TaxID=2755382 RepID=UPI001E3EC95F|nr:alpha/beta fold hydrolase [Nocardia huaxiensis]UFS96071.1 alpha/beta fold hydrolase [Nocardia huaxiensis]
MNIARITHGFVDVDGVRVFYRDTGPQDGIPVLLLHGFPSASHQYRRLMDTLGSRYRLVAPDYPGFGHTEAPADFVYSFDRLADVVEGFLAALEVDRFVLYTFDFGGPIGLRLATRNPAAIAGLIVQNANVYDEGLSDMARATIAAPADALGDLFTLPVTRGQYEGGTTRPELIAPDGWTLDQHFLDLPGRKDAQLALALDYHTNLAHYAEWQSWLREHQPPTLILWGRNDAFFPEAGAHAYLRDLPAAQVHLFETGHFALEENLPEIAPLIDVFVGDLFEDKPMKLAIIGGRGNLGSAVAREAAARGIQITLLDRDTMDVTDVASITRAVAGHDAVVAAIKGADRLVPRGAEALLEALPLAGVQRLVFLGGGGSLEYAPGQRFVDAPDFPAQYLETARDQSEALDIFRRSGSAVRWSYVSPPPVHLVPGEATGTYRAQARDTPIADANGESRISVGDYASAIVDALEEGSFIGERFTVSY